MLTGYVKKKWIFDLTLNLSHLIWSRNSKNLSTVYFVSLTHLMLSSNNIIVLEITFMTNRYEGYKYLKKRVCIYCIQHKNKQMTVRKRKHISW